MAHRSAEPDNVLVVSVRKSFWASPEAERFPHRVYARVFYGHSTNLLNSAVVFARALLAVLRLRPRVVLLGSVERTVPWFIRARRLGLLGSARLIVTNQLHLSDEQLRLVDRNVVYSQAWIDAQGQPVRAAQFLGAAAALREVLCMPLPPADRASYGHTMAAVRMALEEGAFVAAWAAGQILSPEQAIAEAMHPLAGSGVLSAPSAAELE